MSRLAALATIVAALAFLPSPARPCSQAKLPPVDIALFTAAIQQDVLSTMDDTGGVWTLLGPMPISSSEFSVALVDGLFYAVGGFLGPNQTQLLIYDPETDEWSSGKPVPRPTHHAGVVAVDGRVYSIGGTRTENRVQIYDPVTDSWSEGAEMATPRTAPAAVVLDGSIHVIGGTDNINVGVAKKVHEVYHPATDSWESRADVPAASEHVFGQLLDGKIYFAGGRNQFTNTNQAYVYDPDADSWKAIAQLPSPTSGYGPAKIGRRMYAFGGEDILSSTVSSRSQVFDASTGEWQTLEPMPIPLHGHAGGAWGGSIYLFGGAEIAASGQGTNVVLRFDPPFADEPGASPPNRPKKLKAKALSPKKVRLRWKDKSRDESAFEIEMSVEGGAFERLLGLPANTRKRVIKELAPGTTYGFRVRAFNDAGASGYSNERTVTTPI